MGNLHRAYTQLPIMDRRNRRTTSGGYYFGGGVTIDKGGDNLVKAREQSF